MAPVYIDVSINKDEVTHMTDLDKSRVADVTDLLAAYRRALGTDASHDECTAAVQAHLLMEQNRLLAEQNQRLTEISGSLSAIAGAE